MEYLTPIPGEPKHQFGGFRTHKPGCKCYPCKARRRQEEALSGPAGEGGVPVEAQNVSAEESPVAPDTDEQSELADGSKGKPLNVHGREAAILKRNSGDRSARARVGMWLALRSIEPNLSHKDIADRLGITASHMKNLVYKARKEGWLKFDDPMDHIEFGVIPKVIANLDYFLDKKDKTVTIETAKGTVFKQYQESKGISDAPQTVLALKIDVPEAMPEIKVVTGAIVGKPRQIQE